MKIRLENGRLRDISQRFILHGGARETVNVSLQKVKHECR